MIGTHGAVLNGVTFLGAVMPSGKKTETKESEKEVKRFSLPSFQKLLETTPGKSKHSQQLKKSFLNLKSYLSANKQFALSRFNPIPLKKLMKKCKAILPWEN